MELFGTFGVHPATSVYQITKYIYKRLLNDFFIAEDRFGVPSEGWQSFLSLLQFAMYLG